MYRIAHDLPWWIPGPGRELRFVLLTSLICGMASALVAAVVYTVRFHDYTLDMLKIWGFLSAVDFWMSLRLIGIPELVGFIVLRQRRFAVGRVGYTTVRMAVFGGVLVRMATEPVIGLGPQLPPTLAWLDPLLRLLLPTMLPLLVNILRCRTQPLRMPEHCSAGLHG